MPYEEKDTKDESEEISQLKCRLSNFETEKGRLLGLGYQPKTNDEIIITTSPKAGTTWLQQICHQIRSATRGGDMTFTEISMAVPWLELAYDQGQNIDDPQYGEDIQLPRLFKTHAWEPHAPKGCKVIVCVRDPADVVLSFYKFFEDWFFPSGAISIDAFTREFWLARGVPPSRMNNASYFHHLLSWYNRRNDPNILFLCYEDLKSDLKAQVTKIAAFMSTDKHDFTKDEIITQATERSTFEFMKAHQHKFDEKLSKIARNEACGLSKDAGMNSTKINSGTIGAGNKMLSAELKQEIAQKWKDVVEAEIGYSSYSEFRCSLSKS